jgi:DNA-binding PadR family transcriptional regulator
MSVPHTLLGLLEREPSHGYMLKQAYDTYFAGGHPLNVGQIYSTLQRLRRDGLAIELGDEPGDGPRRRLYAITPDGVSRLEGWLAESDEASHARSWLFAKVVVALLTDRSAAQVMDTQRAQHLERMRILTAQRSGSDPLQAVAIDFELAHLAADLKWLESAPRRFSGARHGGS